MSYNPNYIHDGNLIMNVSEHKIKMRLYIPCNGHNENYIRFHLYLLECDETLETIKYKYIDEFINNNYSSTFKLYDEKLIYIKDLIEIITSGFKKQSKKIAIKYSLGLDNNNNNFFSIKENTLTCLMNRIKKEKDSILKRQQVGEEENKQKSCSKRKNKVVEIPPSFIYDLNNETMKIYDPNSKSYSVDIKNTIEENKRELIESFSIKISEPDLCIIRNINFPTEEDIKLWWEEGCKLVDVMFPSLEFEIFLEPKNQNKEEEQDKIKKITKYRKSKNAISFIKESESRKLFADYYEINKDIFIKNGYRDIDWLTYWEQYLKPKGTGPKDRMCKDFWYQVYDIKMLKLNIKDTLEIKIDSNGRKIYTDTGIYDYDEGYSWEENILEDIRMRDRKIKNIMDIPINIWEPKIVTDWLRRSNATISKDNPILIKILRRRCILNTKSEYLCVFCNNPSSVNNTITLWINGIDLTRFSSYNKCKIKFDNYARLKIFENLKSFYERFKDIDINILNLIKKNIIYDIYSCGIITKEEYIKLEYTYKNFNIEDIIHSFNNTIYKDALQCWEQEYIMTTCIDNEREIERIKKKNQLEWDLDCPYFVEVSTLEKYMDKLPMPTKEFYSIKDAKLQVSPNMIRAADLKVKKNNKKKE